MKERDRIQFLIAKAIQDEGRFWVSAAPVPGGFALRLNVISWLTERSPAWIPSWPNCRGMRGRSLLRDLSFR